MTDGALFKGWSKQVTAYSRAIESMFSKIEKQDKYILIIPIWKTE